MPGKGAFSIVAWLKRSFPLGRQVRMAAWLLPPRWRYRFALAISRLQGRLTAARGGNGALTQGLMRDYWLRDLTLYGAYPIPWRLEGRDVLDRLAVPGPVLYSWTHLPLTEIPLRVLAELGYPLPAVVADPGRIVDGKFIIFGYESRAVALPTTLHVLNRMRGCFAAGQSVICLADAKLGSPLSSNSLRVAARAGVPTVFAWATLAQDGVMDVVFRAAPFPFNRSEEEIAANLEFLREANHRALRELGLPVNEDRG